jgi:hypothetical protein
MSVSGCTPGTAVPIIGMAFQRGRPIYAIARGGVKAKLRRSPLELPALQWNGSTLEPVAPEDGYRMTHAELAEFAEHSVSTARTSVTRERSVCSPGVAPFQTCVKSFQNTC